MSRPTLDSAGCIPLSGTRLSLPLACFSKTVPLACAIPSAVRTPDRSRPGLGSSHFARRYFGNRSFFLFLRLLRCFSSPGSLCMAMDSPCSDRGFLCRVSPFGDPWINGYLRLPKAFRSLLRPSSALSAKASTLRSSSLTSSPQPCVALWLFLGCVASQPAGRFFDLLDLVYRLHLF